MHLLTLSHTASSNVKEVKELAKKNVLKEKLKRVPKIKWTNLFKSHSAVEDHFKHCIMVAESASEEDSQEFVVLSCMGDQAKERQTLLKTQKELFRAVKKQKNNKGQA